MSKKERKSPEVNELRQKAEELSEMEHRENGAPHTEGDVRKLLHELEVHQIELEIQNEELRTAIDKAESSTEQFIILYDFAPAGYFTLDRNGTIIQMNFNAAKMLGKERSYLVKNNFKQFISHDTQGAFHEFYQKILESNSKQTCEVRLEIQGKPSMFVHLEGIVSEKNKERNLISAIDITERQRAEDELKNSEARLRELNATKDKFFSIIAHDLRSPFTSILGFSNLLVEKAKEEDLKEIKQYAEIICDSTQKTFDLLVNLLEWSRAQTGSIEFNPRDLDIYELIREVTGLLSAVAKQKSITLKWELQSNVFVYADKAMLSSILRNLISNGIKFSNPGSSIEIKIKEIEKTIMVTVSDEGIGMEKDRLDKLFKTEESKSTLGTQREKGTGLGLLLCKEFITLHKGNIWVQSEPDKGSKFYFTIPSRDIEA